MQTDNLYLIDQYTDGPTQFYVIKNSLGHVIYMNENAGKVSQKLFKLLRK